MKITKVKITLSIIFFCLVVFAFSEVLQCFKISPSLYQSASIYLGIYNGKVYLSNLNDYGYSVTSYVDGKPVGEIDYHEDGSVSARTFYKNGIIDQKLFYDKTGSIITKRIFINGEFIRDEQVKNK